MSWKLYSSRERVISEINITPLTDVMLVLLIIFMVTTPLLMMESFKLKLPRAETSGSESGEGAVITITEDGLIYLDGNSIEKGEILPALKARFDRGAPKAVLLKADTVTMHGMVVEILDMSRQAGADKLSIATERDK